MYNKDAIVVEPAGAMTVAVLDQYRNEIAGKNVVCLLSGSNNDITRTEEIKERALLHAGVKHYFVVRFPQRAGALRDFIDKVLGPNDDITHFEYSKRQSRENAPVVVGIELGNSSELNALIERMKAFKFYGEYLNDKPDLFHVMFINKHQNFILYSIVAIKLLVNPSGRVSLKGIHGVNFFHNRYTDFRLRSGPGILQFPSLIRRSSGLQHRWAEDSG